MLRSDSTLIDARGLGTEFRLRKVKNTGDG